MPISREGDNANVILSRRASKHLELAIVSKLDEIRGTIYVCTDTELLEVKPSYVSARRVSRHAGTLE